MFRKWPEPLIQNHWMFPILCKSLFRKCKQGFNVSKQPRIHPYWMRTRRVGGGTPWICVSGPPRLSLNLSFTLLQKHGANPVKWVFIWGMSQESQMSAILTQWPAARPSSAVLHVDDSWWLLDGSFPVRWTLTPASHWWNLISIYPGTNVLPNVFYLIIFQRYITFYITLHYTLGT